MNLYMDTAARSIKFKMQIRPIYRINEFSDKLNNLRNKSDSVTDDELYEVGLTEEQIKGFRTYRRQHLNNSDRLFKSKNMSEINEKIKSVPGLKERLIDLLSQHALDSIREEISRAKKAKQTQSDELENKPIDEPKSSEIQSVLIADDQNREDASNCLLSEEEVKAYIDAAVKSISFEKRFKGILKTDEFADKLNQLKSSTLVVTNEELYEVGLTKDELTRYQEFCKQTMRNRERNFENPIVAPISAKVKSVSGLVTKVFQLLYAERIDLAREELLKVKKSQVVPEHSYYHVIEEIDENNER